MVAGKRQQRVSESSGFKCNIHSSASEADKKYRSQRQISSADVRMQMQFKTITFVFAEFVKTT